jgi:pSer/pThr/pTyr-binding forkhead associated (FHA) protein
MAIPKIIVLSEIMRGKNFELTGELYTIGRSDEREICIPDGTISTHHASIVKVDDGYIARDNNSTNGTRINGIRITEQALSNSDILQVGGIELLFDCEEKGNTTAITTQTAISLDDIGGGFNPEELKNISGGMTSSSAGAKSNKLMVGVIAVLVIVLLVVIILLVKKLA